MRTIGTGWGRGVLLLLACALVLVACGGTAAPPPTALATAAATAAMPTAQPATVPTSTPVATTTPRPVTRTVATASLAVTAGPAIASPARLGTAARPAATVAAAGLRVTRVDELDLPSGDAFLSPDGQRIAWLAGAGSAAPARELCLYAADGRQERCLALPSALDPASVRWSPDSRRLAFTENFFQSFLDPDILVLDADTGALANLTDDGADRYSIAADARNGDLDTVPCWLGGSKRLLFVRHVALANEIQATVWTVNVEGGAPARLGELNSMRFETSALACAPDGMRIAFNMTGPGVDNGANGVWVADADGRNARRLPSPKPNDRRQVGNVEFSADGRAVVVALFDPLVAPTDPQYPSRVVPLDGGRNSPSKPRTRAWPSGPPRRRPVRRWRISATTVAPRPRRSASTWSRGRAAPGGWCMRIG